MLLLFVLLSPFLVVSLRFRQPYRLSIRMESNLNEWISAQISNKNDVKISITGSPDLSARANCNIKSGDCLFVLPQGLCLDASKAAAKFEGIVSTSNLRTGDYGMIALLLLAEKSLGEQSKFAGYIDNIPQLPPGVMSWDKVAIDELEKSTTRRIGAQFEAINTDLSFINNMKENGRSKVLLQLDVSEESFKWALGSVKSRAVFLDGKLSLIPGMDFIEFDPFCEAEPFVASAGLFGGKIVKIAADRDYAMEDTVYMSYGLKSSAECLEEHGFVPEVPIDDACCEFTVSIDGTERYPDDKIDILERAGYRATEKFDLEAASDVEVDPELLRFLRLKLIEGTDCFILESVFSRTVFDTMNLPFSKSNELKVVQYLAGECARLLDKINSQSSPERDEAIVAEGKKGERSVELAKLRLQERAALEQTITKMRNEQLTLTGLDTREYYQERRLRDLDLLRPLDESEVIIAGERPPNNFD